IWAILRHNEMLTWPEKTKIGNWALAYTKYKLWKSTDFTKRSSHKGKRHVSYPTVKGGTDQALSSSGRADAGANRNLRQLLQTKWNLDWETRIRLVMGSAQGLAYLRHDCVPTILYRDILSGHNVVGNWLKEGSHHDAKYDAHISAAKKCSLRCRCKKGFGKVPPACIFAAVIPALMIAELYFFDCSFASQLAEQKKVNLKKPSAYHYDIFLLGFLWRFLIGGFRMIWSRFGHIRLVVVVFGGALYMRRRPMIRVESQMNGGGQERGISCGTVSTPMVVGMGAACEIAMKEMVYD
nr:cysteine desulfurase, mitochondrial [Tanacetum cinerariifolium]